MARRQQADNRDLNPSPSDVYIELEPTQVPVQHYNTIPRALIQQLPSRDKDVMFELRGNGVRRTSSGPPSLHGTLRLRNIPPSMFSELQEDQVVRLLENDPKNKDLDEVDAEKLKGATLRELHYSLTSKRKIKAKLDKTNKMKQKKLGFFKQTKYSLSMSWQHFKTGFKEAVHSLELWQKPLRTIEGNFGSSVASYFYLLRWLLQLNFITFLILFIFIVLPQLILNHVQVAELDTFPCNSNRTFMELGHKPIAFSPEILLTGGGWFNQTILYYGGYTSYVLSIIRGFHYNAPLAYLMAIGFNLIIVLICMAYTLANKYKERYIEHSGFKRNFFFNKAFCGWDFNITNGKAAQLQSASLQSDLAEALTRSQKQTKIHSLGEKVVYLIKFFLFNAVAFTLLGGTGWLMNFLLEKNIVKNDIEILSELSLSLTVVAITLIVPTILTFMVKFEGYKSQRIQLWVTMIRSLLLIAVILGILLQFWVPVPKEFSITDSIFTDKRSCWETEVGKEIYRLILMDFFVCGIFYFFASWLKNVIHKHGLNCVGNLEYDVAWNTWNLLYNQMLCWIGSFFSPLLPLIVIIKLFLIFYIKQFSVKLYCQPPERAWRAHNAQTMFLVISFLALILSILGIGIIIIYVSPSFICGPFRQVDFPYKIVYCLAQSFLDNDEKLGILATFITKPGCVMILIVFLSCLAYYSRANAAANLKMMKLLQQQVSLEGKDKVFLLHMFDTSLRSWHERPGEGDQMKSLQRNVVEASNFELEPSSSHQQEETRNPPTSIESASDSRRSSTESGKRPEFAKKTTPAEHRILASNSPLSSKRRRKMSNPSDSEYDRSHVELNPYTSHESLTSYPYVNPAYRDDSPYKSYTPPLFSPQHRESINKLSGINHQPPFQNLGRNRRSSKFRSEEDLQSMQRKR